MDCPTGKLRYPTRGEALDSLADIIRLAMRGERLVSKHGEVAVYPCLACYGWHLTSKPRQPDRIVQD